MLLEAARTSPAAGVGGLDAAAAAPELVDVLAGAGTGREVQRRAAAVVARVQVAAGRTRQRRHDARAALLGRHVQRRSTLSSPSHQCHFTS